MMMTLLSLCAAFAFSTPLIPRAILFGNAERDGAIVSPDGKKLAWRAPDANGVGQLWVQTLGQKDEHPITNEKKRPPIHYSWAANSDMLLYAQDKDGDRAFHLFAVDVRSGAVRDLTPGPIAYARLLATSRDAPNEILAEISTRKDDAIYRINLRTGAAKVDTENPGDVWNWAVDSALKVHAAEARTRDGGLEIRVRKDDASPWLPILSAGLAERIDLLGFSKDGKKLYLHSTLGADTLRIVEDDIATKQTRVLAQSDSDASSVVFGSPGVMIDPRTDAIQAAAFARSRLEWTVLDPSIAGDMAALKKLSDGDFEVTSRDDADRLWTILYNLDRGSYRFYLYDRATKRGTFLFSTSSKLDALPLAEMKPVTIRAHDGLQLPSYLSLPPGEPASHLPLVLFVHGGPEIRDNWGFNPETQWLANRGYAVLQVNYRGSKGFGKKFLNAGNRQMGKAMQDDLIDAVHWAVNEGIADPKKIAIYGSSYGGYAALAGVAFTPDVFACAVDQMGPSNLITQLQAMPPVIRRLWNVTRGNPDDPADREMLKRVSPVFSADKIRAPLLIGQGANDTTVKASESEQIVAAIEKNHGRVTYVLYPDEGHGFIRPENRIDFQTRAEKFLSACLGGSFEPATGAVSSAVVREIRP